MNKKQKNRKDVATKQTKSIINKRYKLECKNTYQNLFLKKC